MAHNLFPNVTSKLYNLQEELQYKLQIIRNQCHQTRRLLEPFDEIKSVKSKRNVTPEEDKNLKTGTHCRKDLFMADGKGLSANVPREESVKVSLKDKEFDFKDVDDLLKSVVTPEQLVKEDTDFFSDCGKLEFSSALSSKPISVLSHSLKNGIPIQVLNSIQGVNNYINHRRKPSKSVESARLKFLSHLEKSWEEDFEGFILFEHDLGESLKRYLSVVQEKRMKSKIPERPDPSSEEEQNNQISEEIKNATIVINEALLQDLSCLDFSKLKGKENKDLIIALYHLLTAFRNLKQLNCDYIISKDLSPHEKNSTEEPEDPNEDIAEVSGLFENT